LNVGEALSGKMLGKDNADKFGAPVGMVTTQRLRLKEDGIVSQAKRDGIRAMVSGSGHGVVVETRLAEQVLHGTKAEVEAQGQGVAAEPLALVGLPQGFADRLVDGARHDGSSYSGGSASVPLPYPAQNPLSGFSAKRDVRQQGRCSSRGWYHTLSGLSLSGGTQTRRCPR
jgi:hypothetical protein